VWGEGEGVFCISIERNTCREAPPETEYLFTLTVCERLEKLDILKRAAEIAKSKLYNTPVIIPAGFEEIFVPGVRKGYHLKKIVYERVRV